MAADETDGDLSALLREVAHAPPAPDLPAAAFAISTGGRVGRFEVLGLLGSGGMGVVHEAVDPTLDRRVAIKLLRAGAGAPEAATARLLREAKALARLSHPNVVTIYEAGVDGDRLYIAMELVAGTTARAWRVAVPRTVAEILAVYRQAADGLAAAHRSGLVHRDVKPENILVGDDGRVRVTDFGLVAALDEQAAHEPPTEPATELTQTLTRTGTVLGTPPYMPPEAHLRRETDARSDQWSLCASLWESIAGARPFRGETYAALVESVCAGRIEGGDAVPQRLRPILERGLAVDPAARWPSVDALVVALTNPPRRRRRALLAVGAAGVAVAGVAAIAASPADERAAPAPQASRTPEPRRLTAPGACPYMPAFVDADTIVLDDGNGDLQVIRGDAQPTPLAATPTRSDWRANRGRRPGEAIFVAGPSAGFVDVATGAVELSSIASASLAVAGGTIFYTQSAEIRRVRDGEDAPLFQLPPGRWGYTIAASLDGHRVAVTTAGDRSTPELCLAELGPGSDALVGDVECLDPDVIPGRAAFSPDGDTLYYQTRAGIRRRALRDGTDELWLPGVLAWGGIDVSPDGDALIYSDGRPVGIEVAPVGPRDHAVALGEVGGVVSSADGRWFYARTGKDGDEIVSRALDGTLQVLRSPVGRIAVYSVTRDGGRVAFDLDGDDPGIYVIDTRLLPAVRITLSAADSNPVLLRDGRVAFTRWDEQMRPWVTIADPSQGTRDDGKRPAAHPAPRVTAATLPGTGELVLLGSEAAVYLWDPATGKERVIPLGSSADVQQIVVAPDERSLIALTLDGLWRLSLESAPPEHLLETLACSTLDRPLFDVAGTLQIVARPWRGDVYRVVL